MTLHPKPDKHGKPVVLKKPSLPTRLSAWFNPLEVACVIPLGVVPGELNSIPLEDWRDVPMALEEWEALAARNAIVEPPFHPPKNKHPAAGVVVEEADGRFWLVAPSNAFAGYTTTFPKGTVEPGASKQATAIKEAFEESGLQLELTGFLADVDRTTSYTRYYRAKRVGGNPASMGWESQAVLLVPKASLADFLTNAYDIPLLNALLKG